jgi:IS30 family transposase
VLEHVTTGFCGDAVRFRELRMAKPVMRSEISEIERLYYERKAIKEIAELVGRNPSTVCLILKRRGLGRRSRYSLKPREEAPNEH